jgi:ABC-type glutathione transport system ATPase component
MRQRAMIALALACNPKVLLADEPTTALDATVQIQILLLLRELQRELGLSIIFVTHDLGAAVEVADRIAVMYAGRIVEEGSARDIIHNPRHPYTIGLLKSRAHGAMVKGARLDAIPGSRPTSPTCPPAAPSPPAAAGVPSRRARLLRTRNLEGSARGAGRRTPRRRSPTGDRARKKPRAHPRARCGASRRPRISPPQPGSSRFFAALSSAASAGEPPRSGWTLRISRR